MAAAGLVELWLGVAAEGRALEELALPLTGGRCPTPGRIGGHRG